MKMLKFKRSTDESLDFVENNKQFERKGGDGLWKVIDALREGYPWGISDDGFLVIENPDYQEPDGQPNLVIPIETLILYIVMRERSLEKDRDRYDEIMEQLNRTEKANGELDEYMKKLAGIIGNLVYELPYDYRPGWARR